MYIRTQRALAVGVSAVFFVDDIYKEKYVDLGQNNNPDGE